MKTSFLLFKSAWYIDDGTIFSGYYFGNIKLGSSSGIFNTGGAGTDLEWSRL